jgi:hypothetical protein
MDFAAHFPKKFMSNLYSFGLPAEDKTSRLGAGRE